MSSECVQRAKLSPKTIAQVVGLPLALCSLLAVAWSLVLPVSDHRSLGYLMWKHDLAEWPGQGAWLALLHDAGREELVRGLTRSEVERRFGVSLNAGGSLTDHQARYEPHLREVDHAWIGDSWWLLTFDDGRVTEVSLVKG